MMSCLCLAALVALPLASGFSSSISARPSPLSRSFNARRRQPRSFTSRTGALFASTLSFSNSTIVSDRFQRTAPRDTVSEKECILEIDGVHYNITAWAKAHPGGVNVLRRFHNKDASKAFHAADHSTNAYAMLKDFAISSGASTCPVMKKPSTSTTRRRPRWQQKLFTAEDPIGIHKYLGVFCLLHFIFRFAQMLLGDPSAGLGTRLGRGPAVGPALCLLPHALLSASSLIFHTVPRERVVGKPMIWQEYRVHNIAFGLRSVVCAALAWWSLYGGHGVRRRCAVVGSCATALVAQVVADQATQRLRANTAESTTATMPYWPGCDAATTQKRFKLFYAYSQFMATLACIAVCNPAWGLAVLLAIQMASLLMTLVRKGLLSPKGYHIGYSITLALPYVIGFGSYRQMGVWTFPAMLVGGAGLFQLRRWGLNKYALWLPIYAARILWGDRWIPYQVW